jgi:endonuclease I
MQKKILGFALVMVLVPNIFACQNENNLQLIESQDISSYAKKSKKSLWYEQLPNELKPYYVDAQGKIGEELFHSLHDIISRNNNMESYAKTRAFLFTNVDNIVSKKRNQGGVIDAYSQIFIPGSGELVEGYKEIADENKDGYSEDIINAEHTWPQSFYGSSLPMVSDLHALQTVLRMPNVMRSDFPFGEVKNDVTYSTNCGSKLSVLDLQGKPVTYKKAKVYLEEIAKKPKTPPKNDIEPSPPPTGDYRGIFEPCNEQKGNTARNMLYFYLRYHDMYIRQGSYNADNFWKSKVKMFIRWSQFVDLPDTREKLRNDIIFNKQGNRNPFVDIPELASIIGEEPFLKN